MAGAAYPQLNVIELRTHENPVPMASPAVAEGASPADFRGLRRSVPETWKQWLRELASSDSSNALVAVLDSEGVPERIVREMAALGIPVATGEVVCESPAARTPETVWILPGRSNPGRALQGVTDLRRAYPRAAMAIVYPREDLDAISGILDDLYPGRERLLEVYRRLKEEFGREEFELEDAMLVLKVYSRSLLTSCCRIFEELDLAAPHNDRARTSLKPVRVRRDILMSPTYRQGQALREQWNAWIDALQAPENAWLRFLDSNGRNR